MPPTPSPGPTGVRQSRSPPPMPPFPSQGPAGAPTGVLGWCGGDENTGESYVHANNRLVFVSHFQNKADLVLVPIQCQHLQYLHPNIP